MKEFPTKYLGLKLSGPIVVPASSPGPTFVPVRVAFSPSTTSS